MPDPNKITLSNTISSAISLVAATYEGAAAGYYIRGSQLILKVAISTAQAVYATVGVTQAQLDQANTDLLAAVSVYNTQKVAGVDPTNLVGQWTFDRIPDTGVGTVVKDYSGNGHDGVVSVGHVFWLRGTPTLGTDRYGVWGSCLHFTRGANVEVPYSSDFNGPLVSISLWVRVDLNFPILGNQFAVSLNRLNCYSLNFNDTPEPVFSAQIAENPGTIISDNSGSITSQNIWKHFVVTFGDGHMRFYENGVLTRDVAHAGTIIRQTPSINLVFGQDLPTNQYSLDSNSPFFVNTGGFFAGYMDEIRIYKSVLTASQVNAIYAIEKP